MNNRNTKLPFTVLVIICICVIVALFFILTGERGVKGGDEAAGVSMIVRNFETALTQEATKRIGGIPIEGFDASVLKHAFPSLTDNDFDGVKTSGGMYKIEKGSLIYVRASGGVVSSAEQTISEEGYAQLLENLSRRYSTSIKDEASLNEFLQRIFEEALSPPLPHPLGNILEDKIIYGMDAPNGTAVFEQDCREKGGVFNTCGSSCASDAEVCAAVCAYTCEFK